MSFRAEQAVLEQVRQLALELLQQHRLDWSFSFNRRKTQMGLCVEDERSIQLSVHFVALNDEEAIRDTLLHEIAHALVGTQHGHGSVWKTKCLELGARPERLSYDCNMPEGRWRAQCSGCGMEHHRHRKPKHMVGWFCRHCGRERGRLRWALAG
jgi:predicted SprT family Zn-dependent metalloprotease